MNTDAGWRRWTARAIYFLNVLTWPLFPIVKGIVAGAKGLSGLIMRSASN